MATTAAPKSMTPTYTETRSVRLEHPEARFLHDLRVVLCGWPDGVTTAEYLPLDLTGAAFSVQQALADLASALVGRACELRDRGDDQLTPEDLRVWGQLSQLLVLHDQPPPAPDDGWWHRREALGRGWWLDCWSNGGAELTWHSPRWSEREGATQAVLHLEPAEARHLATLLEGRAPRDAPKGAADACPEPPLG